jgi:hypothetical protein
MHPGCQKVFDITYLMKYNILINQKSLVDNGFNIDLIVNYFVDFMFTGKMKTIVEGNDLYYKVSYSEIIRQLPLLRIKEKDSIYRRFKRLTEAGLLVPYPDNQKLNAAFYRITEVYSHVLFSEETDKDNPRFFYGTPTAKMRDVPTAKKSDNNTISLNTISDKEEKIKNSKIKFCKWVITWATKNPDKYPKLMYFEFTKHWLELAQSEKSLRYEDEKFFEIGKRLATWFSYSDNKKLSDQWSAEKQTETINSLLRKLL